ncbi:MAG: pseudouridine synthase [Oligoflexia bacterium]|nr:pseudouridine synthase [Oligoflexia bacterium]
MALERVQKILAQAGITSRRKAEALITEGAVTINGKVAKLGDKAEFGVDAIKVSGKLLLTKQTPIYLAFNKPKGVLSTLFDPENRPTLAPFLEKVKERVYPVGRLDFNSEGLILLTNDGEIAERIQKAQNLLRIYHVKVKGRPEAAQIARLEKGARLGNRLVQPHAVRFAEELPSKVVLEVSFTDPGIIDVKALFESKGFLVDKITRTAIGQITTKGIALGAFRELEASQLEALLKQPELGLRRMEAQREAGARTAEGGFQYRRPSAAAVVKERKKAAADAAAGETSDQPQTEISSAPRIVVRAGAKSGASPSRPLRSIRPSGIVVRKKADFREEGDFRPRSERGGFGEKRGGFREKREGFGEKREGFGEKRGGFGKPRAGGFKKREGFGEKRESFGEKRKSFGEKRGGFGEERGGFGKPRAGGFKKREGFGEKRESFGEKRKSFGEKRGGFESRGFDRGDRPSRPRTSGGPARGGKSFGGPRGPKRPTRR